MNKYDSNVYLLGPNPNCLTNLAIIHRASFGDPSDHGLQPTDEVVGAGTNSFLTEVLKL